MEIWKVIPGHPGYEASTLGRIRSVDRKIVKMIRGTRCLCSVAGRILKPWVAGEGYLYVSLGTSAKGAVHRYVCHAFNGDATAKVEVSHLDGNRQNNVPANLAWETHGANEQRKREHGTYRRPCNYFKAGQKKRGPKATRHPLADALLSMRETGATLLAIASSFGLSKSGVHGILKCRV
jgi:hypothetical protein